MYNQDYEEYMRSVLGYSPNYQDTTYRDNDYYGVQNQFYYNDKLEMMYPEIYRNVYPLIMREIGMNNKPITEELLEEMVEKIYIEIDGQQNNRTLESEKVDTKSTNTISSNNIKIAKSNEIKEDRQIRPRNNTLRDLIRILLLRELLGRPVFPNRPPRPGLGRPPFPGGPGMPPPPPPRPRDYYM